MDFLGRVLYFLKKIYDQHKIKYFCYDFEKKNGYKLNNIINDLLEKDVYKRITIIDCKNKYF